MNGNHMNGNQVNCKYADSLLQQYLEQTLPAEMKGRLQSHLDSCPRCTANLHTAINVAARLEKEVQGVWPETRDLYPAFRERLAMQHGPRDRNTRTRWTGRLLRIAVPGLGTVALAFFLLSHYTYSTAALAQIDDSLCQPSSGPIHIYTIMQGAGPHYFGGYATSDLWEENGYHYSVTTTSESARVTLDVAHKTQIQKVPQPTHGYLYSTPGGVRLEWGNSPRLGEEDAGKIVHMSWEPTDPEEPGQDILQTTTRSFREMLYKFISSGHGSKANVEVTSEQENSEPFDKITLHHFKEGIVAADMVNEGEKQSLPDTFRVWIDHNKRLRRYQMSFSLPDGTHWDEWGRINYDQKLMWMQNPVLPQGKPVILTDHLVKGIPTGAAGPNRPAKLVDPVWFTLSHADREQIRKTVRQFAQAWSRHDVASLRARVDKDTDAQSTEGQWPIVAARRDEPGKQASTDAWQTVWAPRLAREPAWQEFRILPDFAYRTIGRPAESTVPLPAKSPLSAIPWKWTASTLPTLNVLAWVKATTAQDAQITHRARLGMIKRAQQWQVRTFVLDE